MPAEFETLRFSTKRNLLLFAFSFAAAAGFSFNVRPLIFLSECILVLAIISWLRSGRRPEAFLFRRTHLPRCFENDVVQVELVCDYSGKTPLCLAEIRDTFPPGESYFVNNLAPSIRRSHTLHLTYDNLISRRRGLYTIGPVRVTTADPLGININEHEFPVFSTLHVYPSVPEIENFALVEEGTLRHVGQEVVSRPGRSEEFRSIREYRPGDAPSHVHWPSTARFGYPMVREFDENIVTDVSIFLDLHRLSLRGLGDVTSLEYMIKAAVSITQIAIGQSHRVQLFAIGKTIDHIPLGGGGSHLLAILDRMTLYRATGEHDFLEEVYHHMALLPPGGTVALVVSATNFDLERARPMIEQMIFDRMRVIVVLINDRSFIKIYREQETLHQQAPDLKTAVNELKRLGCRIITVDSGDNLRVRMELVE